MPKIDYNKVAKICLHVREGLPLNRALIMEGVTKAEWEEWIKDKRVKRQVEEAETLLMKDLLQPLMEKAVKERNWRAAESLLKRRFPEEWGGTGEGKINININVKELEMIMRKPLEILGKPQRQLPSADEVEIIDIEEG